MVWGAAVTGVVATSPSASGQEAVEPGLGSAYAQGYKVDPRSGRLSFGITYGMALAGHQNTVAIAEARSADLGVIGTTLGAEKCDGGDPTLPKEDQPQPLVVRSTDEGGAGSRTESENGVEKRAEATDEPYARAEAITLAGGQEGLIELGSTRSETVSGIVDGTRRATGITEVSILTLGGGAVVLEGLRWEATYQTAPTEALEGTFSIEGIEVAGQALPVPEDDPLASLAELNAVLDPLGLVISPPVIRTEAGIQFVDPMRISIVPSETRDGVLGPVLGALQPVRESVFDAIIEADCANAAYITIGDLVLGSVTGAGSLTLEIGGVTATSKDLQATSFLGGLPDLDVAAPATPALPDTPARLALDNSGTGAAGAPGPASSAPPNAGGPTTDEVAMDDLATSSGSRGGPLVGVGLGGLLLLAALAEADRRKMRRAQRSVPMEVMG